MKIFVDTSTITENMSGTGVYTRGLVSSLLDRPEVDQILAAGGIPEMFYGYNSPKLHHLFRRRTDWHTLLNRDLAGNRPNIQADLALFPNYFMPPGFSIPSLVTVHDLSFLSHPEFYTAQMRWFYRKRITHSFKRSESILTVSESSGRQINRFFPAYGSKVKVIRPGHSFRNIDRHVDRTASKTFLYLGTLEPRKNILRMLEGFNRAHTGAARLLLIGKMNGSRSYEQKVWQKLKSTSNILYLGYQSDEKVRQYLSSADAVVNVSRLEGFGLSILEALAAGIPCMISKDPALQELAGGHATTVDANSVDAIAEGFAELVRQKRSRLNGYSEEIRDNLEWDSFGRELVAHSQQLLSGRKPSMNSRQLVEQNVQQYILEALAYSAVFRAPIEIGNLHRVLTCKVSYRKMKRQLNDLHHKYPHIIGREGPFVSLKHCARSGKDFFTEKRKNQAFLQKHRSLLKWVDRIPWIQGLYFSGGSVHGSQLEERDIDLFIVTDSNRVWLVYALLKVLSKVYLSRTVLCYNYLVDQEAVNIHYQRDYFTAHQLLFLQPALPNRNYPDVLARNKWVYQYFPNARISGDDEVSAAGSSAGKQNTEAKSLWDPFRLMNLFLMTCFSFLWRRKGYRNLDEGLMWDAHRIKLHTNDHRPWIYEKFEEIMNELRGRIGIQEGERIMNGRSKRIACESFDEMPDPERVDLKIEAQKKYNLS